MATSQPDAMSALMARVASFTRWSGRQQPVKPLYLAREGFYLTQTGVLQCFRCGLELEVWTSDQQVSEQHKERSPQCRPVKFTRPRATVQSAPGEPQRSDPGHTGVSGPGGREDDTETGVSSERNEQQGGEVDVAGDTPQESTPTNVEQPAASVSSTEGAAVQSAEAAVTASTARPKQPLSPKWEKDRARLLAENAAILEARLCKVCMDQDSNTVFLPCGHLISCNTCAEKLTHCALCRTFIKGTVRAFRT